MRLRESKSMVFAGTFTLGGIDPPELLASTNAFNPASLKLVPRIAPLQVPEEDPTSPVRGEDGAGSNGAHGNGHRPSLLLEGERLVYFLCRLCSAVLM